MSLLNLSCIFSILVSGYLSVTPFCFQDFGSFSLSLFGILYQVDSLSLPFCLFYWTFILFLYLLGISLPLHLVYIAVFGVAFPYSGSLWSSLYCGVSLLLVGLDRWLVKFSWLGKSLSVFWWVELDFCLWSAIKCPVISYEMSVGLE